MEKEGTDRKKRAWKIAKICIFSILGLWAAILTVLQIVLSPGFLTKLANKYAAEFVDADISFRKVNASVFRNFPFLNVTFDSLSVTYPADKFEKFGAGTDWYTRQGRGENCDTLMSFSRLSASVDLSRLVAGQINIPRIMLSKPRIFATAYNDTTATWNVFKATGNDEETADTTENAGLPDMVIGRIRLDDNPRIVFNSIPDSINLSLNLKRMVFFGRVVTKDIKKSRLGLRVDTLFLAGRFPTDTVALRLDNFVIRGKDRGIETKALATAYLAMNSYGRMKLPVAMDARISFPEDTVRKIRIERFKADFADIPLSAQGDVAFKGDSLYIKGGMKIEDCEITRPIE